MSHKIGLYVTFTLAVVNIHQITCGHCVFLPEKKRGQNALSRNAWIDEHLLCSVQLSHTHNIIMALDRSFLRAAIGRGGSNSIHARYLNRNMSLSSLP